MCNLLYILQLGGFCYMDIHYKRGIITLFGEITMIIMIVDFF
jgi:hypothetical protein